MSVEASRYQKNIGSIHTHTSFSGMRFSPRQTAESALRSGLKVLIFTDYSDRKWKYHLNIGLERPSILSKGVDSYLSMTSEIRNQFKELTVLDGVEASPFYYWQGNPFWLTCREYNRHILIFGLQTQADYRNLPLVANDKSGFNPFSGDQGAKPYQQLIDYANQREALTFWAHPEQEDNTKFFTARLYTPPRPEILNETYDYTGFSSFPRGHRIIPQPGGIWDQVLIEFCDGVRNKPIWTIGESDFRKKFDDIANPTTVFIGPVNDGRDVLSSLKEGRFYALDSPDKGLFLDQFYIVDNKRRRFASMGQTLNCSSGTATVHINIISKDELKKVILIKNGTIIKETKDKLFEFNDRCYADKGKTFYRLSVETVNGSMLLSNPIFVAA